MTKKDYLEIELVIATAQLVELERYDYNNSNAMWVEKRKLIVKISELKKAI